MYFACPGCGAPVVWGWCVICTPSVVERPVYEITHEPLLEVHYTGRLFTKPYRKGFGNLARVDAIRAVRGTPESRAKTAYINRTRVVTPEAAARKSAKCRAAALRSWAKRKGNA